MSTFEQRAAARAGWPVRRSDPSASEAPAPLDGTAAWNAVTELTWEAYSLAGGVPDCVPRGQWPSRLFKPGEVRPDSHGR